MIIAVDFDGTIVEHRYPEIGKPIPFAIETLKKLQNDGHRLIMWTVREDDTLQAAIDYCAKQGLYFYAHNANFPEETEDYNSRKLTADLFIDDRNVGGLPSWSVIYEAVKAKRKGIELFQQLYIPHSDNQSDRKKGWRRFFNLS